MMRESDGREPIGEEPDANVDARIAWSGSVAYVEGRVLLRDEAAADHLDKIVDRRHHRIRLGNRLDVPEAAWMLLEDVEDTLSAVRLLRADGFTAQPDHVLFAHCDPCCGPHPAVTFDALDADPYKSTPYKSTPYKSTPYKSTPYKSTPYKSTPYKSTPYKSTPYRSTRGTSSALPAAERVFPARTLTGPGAHPRVVVLDTGLAQGSQCPPLLNDPNRLTGTLDEPDAAITVPGAKGATVVPSDKWLDPVAGHGTFIAGIVEQLAPGCAIGVEKLVQPLGYATESLVHQRILALAQLPDGQRPDIISMSFGAPVLDDAAALRTAVAKARQMNVVLVASAGNDGSSQEYYPAAYDEVIAVAALGPDGPAPWTNYGSWVNACAPGVDLVSAFFAKFDGPDPKINTEDPDNFAGWATWSGTSFAVPVVVAAIAREMVLGSCDADMAAARVLASPAALQIRCMGTVVGT